MEMTVFITLLEIQVTVVALVDCSGFMDWLKGKISEVARRLKVHRSTIGRIYHRIEKEIRDEVGGC